MERHIKKYSPYLWAIIIVMAIVLGVLYSWQDREIKDDKNVAQVVKPVVETEDTNTIGGQRDLWGCLTPAGYTYNENIPACVRTWEITENKAIIANQAVSHIGWSKGLTILAVEISDCEECYIVEMEKEGVRLQVDIKGNQIIKVKNLNVKIN